MNSVLKWAGVGGYIHVDSSLFKNTSAPDDTTYSETLGNTCLEQSGGVRGEKQAGSQSS